MWAFFLFTACAKPNLNTQTNGVTIKINGHGSVKTVRLQVVNNNVIRVTASPLTQIVEDADLIRDPALQPSTPFTIEERGDTVKLRTATVTASVLKSTGRTFFADSIGKPILSEANNGRSFTPFEAEGTTGYTIRQTFDDPGDEALYGLGQHQSDEFDYKGKNEELFQYNTKVSVPLIVSTRGYGILWHNYSLSRFGDQRPYANISDAFILSGPNGQKDSIAATYLSTNRQGEQLRAERNEQAVDYETLTTIRNLPRPFPRGEASATWEGSLQPKSGGLHRFKLHYAGYVKVYIDNKEVVAERWRTAWNPNDYKFSLDMQKGKQYPIRIEWRPDGNISYLGLKVLTPVPDSISRQTSFWSEMADNVDYYFIRGASLDDVVGGYRTVTGKSQIMPKWAMGYWLSREHYKTQAEVLETVAEYRLQQVPLDVIVQDWNYWPRDSWGSHEFDPARYPDPKAMIDEVHRQDARFMISVWPKFYHTTRHYKELDSLGAIYPQAIKDSIRDWIYPGYIGSFYDAYNPAARSLFWQQLNEHIYSLGVDAWWMDASEPNIQDNTEMDYRKLLCTPTFLGPSAKYFNAYALVNAEAIYNGQRSANPDARVFLLTRSGFAGLQRYSTATWSGDIATRWEDMKAQISAGINFALSGIPWWTMDIGGFCVEKRYERMENNSPDQAEWQELNLRWYQFGAFCPLFRSHGQYPYREIYNISKQGSPTWLSMKYYNELRYRLLPYIYSLAAMTHYNDYTIMRALAMDHPADRAARNISDQYKFGPSIMVSPVYSYNRRSRPLYLPPGQWYDFYSGENITGGQTIEAPAPLNRIPLHVPAGAIIPMGNVIQTTAHRQSELNIMIYAGADGSFTLYDDNGLTYAYEQNQYSRIRLSYSDASRRLALSAREGLGYEGMPASQPIAITLVTPGNPSGKTVTVEYIGEALEVSLP
jgi:alpha-D-xyloside xylohydrolase